MNLASYQRAVRDALKDRASGDQWSVSGLSKSSPRLQLLQEIVLWWRLYALEEFCVLTSRLLKRNGEFESTVQKHIAEHSISPYIEEMGLLFLETTSHASDPLVAAVARFEAAMIRTRKGDRGTFAIQWPQEPYGVIASLLNLHSKDVEVAHGDFRTIVSAGIQSGFVVEEGLSTASELNGEVDTRDVKRSESSIAAGHPPEEIQLPFPGEFDSAARTSRTCFRREVR